MEIINKLGDASVNIYSWLMLSELSKLTDNININNIWRLKLERDYPKYVKPRELLDDYKEMYFDALRYDLSVSLSNMDKYALFIMANIYDEQTLDAAFNDGNVFFGFISALIYYAKRKDHDIIEQYLTTYNRHVVYKREGYRKIIYDHIRNLLPTLDKVLYEDNGIYIIHRDNSATDINPYPLFFRTPTGNAMTMRDLIRIFVNIYKMFEVEYGHPDQMDSSDIGINLYDDNRVSLYTIMYNSLFAYTTTS